MAYLTYPTVDATTAKALPGPSSFKPTVNFKLKESKFGDRYTQATPDGINFKYYSWDIGYETLWNTEKDTIKNFLEARGNYQTFLWTSPETSIQYRVKCRQIEYEWDKKAGVWNMTIKLEQAVK